MKGRWLLACRNYMYNIYFCASIVSRSWRSKESKAAGVAVLGCCLTDCQLLRPSSRCLFLISKLPLQRKMYIQSHAMSCSAQSPPLSKTLQAHVIIQCAEIMPQCHHYIVIWAVINLYTGWPHVMQMYSHVHTDNHVYAECGSGTLLGVSCSLQSSCAWSFWAVADQQQSLS